MAFLYGILYTGSFYIEALFSSTVQHDIRLTVNMHDFICNLGLKNGRVRISNASCKC